MRVLFLINALGRGGAERVFVDDANDLVARGEEVHVALLYRRREQHELIGELDKRVAILLLDARGAFDISAINAIRRYVRDKHIDVIFSTLNDGNIVGRFVAMFSGSRLVTREANDPRRKTWWQRVLDVGLSTVPTAIIVVTEDTRRKVLRQIPWLRTKIRVIYNAAPSAEVSAQEKHQEPTFVFVGRFDEQKDPCAALRAFALVNSSIPSRLRMIGDGSLQAAATALAVQLRVSDQVTFCGVLSHDDTVREIARADALVLSSRWEGCPNVVLEAMAVGTPIVATEVGGVPELVDSQSGVLVPPNNPHALAAGMRRIAEDRAGARALGDAARNRAESLFSRGARLTRLTAVLSLE